MRRVKLLTDRAGVLDYQPAGSEIELPKAEAERLIAAGQAEPAPPASKTINRGA